MKNKFALLILISIFVALIVFRLLSDTEPMNEKDVLKKKPITPISKPEKIPSQTDTEKSNNTTNSTLPSETKPNEAPIIEGKKERPATLTQKDELYTEELVLEREKVTVAEPVPLRPKQPFIKWVMQFSGSVAGAIASKDNKLHFGTYDYQVFTLNAESGEVLNQAKTVSQPINSTRLYKDLFLIPQRNGQVTAYSITDGKEKWNHRSAVDKNHSEIDLSISHIAVYGNRFYISKHWGNLYIASTETGILEQDVGVTYESRINLPAIKTTDGILFSNIAGELHCFKDDGSENWNFTIPKGYPLSMHLKNDFLFILNTERELFALNIKDRTVLWAIELTGFGFDSIAITHNTIFVFAKDLYSIDIQNGKINWQIKSKSPEGFCRGAPIIFEENLFATEQNGRLVRATLNDGKIIKEFDFNETIRSPISISNEILFLPTTMKKIYAINAPIFK